MPGRFDIYIVYKWHYINSLPFLSFPLICRYAAYCELPSSVVCLSPSEPCRKFGSDRDTVCVQESGGPREKPVAYSRPIRGEYCIVFIQYNTAI